MASSDMFDAFDDCITRLHAGQSVEDCLRAYPQYAATLRPMLEIGLSVRRATPAVPAGARSRVRARVIRPHLLRWRTYHVRSAAAVVLVALFVAALIAIWWNHDDDRLRVEPIPTVNQPTSTPTPNQTPTPTSTPTGTAVPWPTAAETVDPLPLAAPTYSHATPTSLPALECRFKVTVSSANLRLGPGTGYSILGLAYSGDEYPVLAHHTSGEWFEITTESGSAWIAVSVGELNGDCAALPISDRPLIAGSTTDDGNSGPDDSGGDGAGPDNYSGDSGGSVSGDDNSIEHEEEQNIEQEPEPTGES